MPDAIALAIELGILTLALGAVAQVGRLAKVLPVLLVLALAEAFRRGALHPAWVLESVVYDVPWLPALLVVAVQLAVLAAAPVLLRVPPLRVVWLALAAPLVAGRVGPQLAREVPGGGERAGLVLIAVGLSSLVPVVSPAAGMTGLVGDARVALGAMALGGIAWAIGRRSSPREATKPPAPEWRWREATVPVLGAGVAMAILGWLAILGGVVEFAGAGLEQAPVYLPRVTEAVIGLAGALVGAMTGPLAGVLVHETELRALALKGDELRMALRVGIAIGGGLPLLLATRSSLRVGLPFWLLQVVWVAGCLLSS